MSVTPRKTIVIGLELGDGELVRAWADAGRLPFLKAMIDEGCWGWLETTADQLHISAWPSIYTGAAPGEHGVYFTFQPAPGVQGHQRFHEGLYGRPTLWQMLDRHGVRCSVFDAPYSHPEQGYSGAFIYDWGSWAHYLKPGSVPPTLIKNLEKNCGTYPLGSEANDLGFAYLEPTDTAKRLVRSVKAKADATCWLMRESHGDFVLSVFGETHVAGHYCWSNELATPAGRAAPSPMLAVYEALDSAIAQIHRAAGSDVNFIVISGDRVGPNNAGWHLLPDVLNRLGFMAKPGEARSDEAAPAPTKKFDPIKSLRDLLPKDFRKALARKLPTALRDRLAKHVDTADIDWSRTRAFCLPTDLEGYIRINLKGREPHGTVEPGTDYEKALSDLSAALLQLRDSFSGQPIVREVIRTDREFPGDRRAYLPDLVVRWHADRPIRGATSARIGTVETPSPDTRPGTHTGPGFLIAAGPDIAAGSRLQSGHILDFAPTMLALFGVPVPATLRGRVWPELTAAISSAAPAGATPSHPISAPAATPQAVSSQASSIQGVNPP